MDDWLLAARKALAEAANLTPDDLDLRDDDESTLLELARLTAHESGARTNRSLLCYLIGPRSARRNPRRPCGSRNPHPLSFVIAGRKSTTASLRRTVDPLLTIEQRDGNSGHNREAAGTKAAQEKESAGDE